MTKKDIKALEELNTYLFYSNLNQKDKEFFLGQMKFLLSLKDARPLTHPKTFKAVFTSVSNTYWNSLLD